MDLNIVTMAQTNKQNQLGYDGEAYERAIMRNEQIRIVVAGRWKATLRAFARLGEVTIIFSRLAQLGGMR